MGAIKKAFKAIGHGIGEAAKGLGQIAKGVATLDLKGIAKGVKEISHAGTEISRGMLNLTPAALAANTLLNGAMDKILKKAQSITLKVADAMVDNVEGSLSNVKNGVIGTVKGLANGNIGQALNGIKNAAVGAMDLASNFGPGGVAKNVARLAVDAAVGLAAEKASEAVAKKLDPNGTSVLGGLAAEMTGAAIQGAGGAGRTGGGFRADASNAVRTGASDATQLAVDTATQQAELGISAALSSKGGLLADAADTSSLTSSLEKASNSAPTASNAHVGAGGKLHRGARREAVEAAAQKAFEVAIPLAINVATQNAINGMSLDNARALASLRLPHEAGEGLGKQMPKHKLGEAIRSLRQELNDAIELSSLQAMERGIPKIADSALQIALATGAMDSSLGKLSAQSQDKLRQALHGHFATALQSVDGSVSKAVMDIAAKAMALGLHATDTNQLAAMPPAVQVSAEVVFRA